MLSTDMRLLFMAAKRVLLVKLTFYGFIEGGFLSTDSWRAKATIIAFAGNTLIIVNLFSCCSSTSQ